jgi:hypothetical protein
MYTEFARQMMCQKQCIPYNEIFSLLYSILKKPCFTNTEIVFVFINDIKTRTETLVGFPYIIQFT